MYIIKKYGFISSAQGKLFLKVIYLNFFSKIKKITTGYYETMHPSKYALQSTLYSEIFQVMFDIMISFHVNLWVFFENTKSVSRDFKEMKECLSSQNKLDQSSAPCHTMDLLLRVHGHNFICTISD